MIVPKPKTVIVADDQPHIAEVIRLSLEGAECRVEIATSGPEVLRKAKAEPIDLLIIDVSMPGMNGFETVLLLKEIPGQADVPIIILTGSGDAKVRLEAERLGVAIFFTKPFSPSQLQRCVQRLLNS